MASLYYKKTKRKNLKLFVRLIGTIVFLSGLIVVIYIFFPLISWQIYFASTFADSDIATPIPKATVINPKTIQSLLSQATANLGGSNYSDIKNWFPNLPVTNFENNSRVPTYKISIPKINIKEAVVSTMDTNIDKHLINYPGTAIPPNDGNAVIIGHSTLPQLFNPKDYKTIFANAHKLTNGDEIFVMINNVVYKYKVFKIIITEPEDSSVFAQNIDNSYLSLFTCTPPGTVWKRLVVKARLEKI